MKRNEVVKVALLLLASVGLTGGCGTGVEPASEGSAERGSVAAVDVPLRDPAWSAGEGLVIALQEDGRRLVRFDTGEGFDPSRDFPTTISEELEGTAGENLALEDARLPDAIYVPKPQRDQVTVVENDDLLEVRSFNAGESPARVALGGSTLGQLSPTLFALSEGGSTVTLVGLDNFDTIARVEVGASEDALIEASGEYGFWLAGPNGVALYDGTRPELQGELPLEAGSLAVDAADSQRAYAGEESGRVVAVEPGVDGEELQIVAEAELGAAAEYLAAEEGRLYAITRDELVVLDSETLERIEGVEIGPALEREEIERARPSGMAVGEENVYVTLEGVPYVLLIEKP